MAKTPKQQEVQLANARDTKASKDLDRYYAQLKQMNIAKEMGVVIDEKEVKLLKEKIALKRKEVKATQEAGELAKTQFQYYDDILSIAGRINKNFEKTNAISSKVGDQFNVLTGYAGELAKNLKEGNYYTKEGAAAAKDSAVAMENYSSAVSDAMRNFKKGSISADSLVSSLQQADDALSGFIDDLDDSNAEVAKLKAGLISTTAATKDLSKSFGQSKKALSDISSGLQDVASNAASGIPGASGLVSALGGLGTAGFIGGIFAVGLALGELASYLMDVFGIAGLWSGQTETQKEANLELTKSINGLNRELISTSQALGQNIAIGGAMVANMAKMGVSANEFGDATKYASNNLGLAGANAQKAGADVAMMAARTGVSADQLGSIANTFRIVGNLSGQAAVNSLGMAESMAKATGVPINALMEDLAESSELLLQNNYGNEQSLIKQVATLRVMGVAAQKVLQAGQNMVLNYKDSIKAEMKLSALLGKQVDLSRVRQKFASGDAAGAADALRTQLKGIDMDKMNMFQRQALQEATGMDMDTIMKLGKGGKGGPLKTQQEEQLKSLNNIGTIMGRIEEQFKNGTISIQDKNREAADALFAGKIAAAQADKRAVFDTAMLDFKDKALLYLAGIALALAVGGIAKLLKGPLKKAFTKTAAKTTSKVVAKKVATKAVAKKVATETAKKAATKAATKTVATKVATKGGTGILSKIASIIPGVGNAGKAGAGGLMSGIAKGGMKGIMGNLGKGLLKGGPIGLLGTVASMAGDYVGGQRQEQGMAEGDRGKVNQGKALKTGATALEYAGYGAAIGSIIPGIGTAVGGAIGGVVGGIKGIWDNWFSDDAKAADEQLKKTEEQNKVAAAQKVLSERDMATQEDMKKNSATLATAAHDTGFFQAAMVAQLVEATRLLDIIAFGSNAEKVTKEIFLDGKKITRLNYDRASTLYNTMSTQKAAAK
jgi:hypothetical protein